MWTLHTCLAVRIQLDPFMVFCVLLHLHCSLLEPSSSPVVERIPFELAANPRIAGLKAPLRTHCKLLQPNERPSIRPAATVAIVAVLFGRRNKLSLCLKLELPWKLQCNDCGLRPNPKLNRLPVRFAVDGRRHQYSVADTTVESWKTDRLVECGSKRTMSLREANSETFL